MHTSGASVLLLIGFRSIPRRSRGGTRLQVGTGPTPAADSNQRGGSISHRDGQGLN